MVRHIQGKNKERKASPHLYVRPRENRKWKEPCDAAPELVPASSHSQRSCVCICIITICEPEGISRCAYIDNIFRNQNWDASDRENTLERRDYCFGVL